MSRGARGIKITQNQGARVAYTLRLSEGLHGLLVARAEESGIALNEYITKVLQQECKRLDA